MLLQISIVSKDWTSNDQDQDQDKDKYTDLTHKDKDKDWPHHVQG